MLFDFNKLFMKKKPFKSVRDLFLLRSLKDDVIYDG